MWDPGQYRQFADERSRPFYELVGRIDAESPGLVADLGCGPGELTADLSRRWPDADVVGVDSSAEMIAAAEAVAGSGRWPRLRFLLQDAWDWTPPSPVDVLVSNALLQWVPDHQALVTRWAGWLAGGGWIALQVPANFGEPTHRLIREICASPRWQPLIGDVNLNRQGDDPAEYLDLLTRAGCASVDAWETTYLHVLDGDDAVLRWITGTGLRPVLATLDDTSRAEFLSEYGALLREAYPRQSYGTPFPFRRVFVVARAA
jgi:trans-aconitate 2-methyltransferase